MDGKAEQIVHDAAVTRIERHEYQYEQEQGMELYAQERKAYEQLNRVLKKLPEEDQKLFQKYSDARAADEAERNYYLYQAGFKDGVCAMKTILKW